MGERKSGGIYGFYWLPTAIVAVVSLVTNLISNIVAPSIGDALEPWVWIIWLVFGVTAVATIIIAIVSSRGNRGIEPEPGERSAIIGGDVHGTVNTGDGNIFAKTVNFIDGNGAQQKDEGRERALLTNYLRRVQIEANALPLSIIDDRAYQKMQQRSMNLLPLYIMLDTTTRRELMAEDRPRIKLAGQRSQIEKEETPLSVIEAISNDRYVVLLGDPGSGKSTFVNYLSLCFAGSCLEQSGGNDEVEGNPRVALLEPAWKHGTFIPIVVILRHFARSASCDGTAEGLLNFLVEMLAKQSGGDLGPFIINLLVRGGAFVMFDGLDEVGEQTKRTTVHEAVEQFAATYNAGGNRFLVTCRGYAYRDVDCKLNDFIEHTLAPLNENQISAFIEGWYGEATRLAWKKPDEAGELKRQLIDACSRSDLAPLASNPLQLAMMTSLQFSWGRLPDDRVDLYAEMVRLLLVRWQEARLGIDAGVSSQVREADLEEALELVAYTVHRSQGGAAGAADISQTVLLTAFKDLYKSWDMAEHLVRYIQERAGLLIEKGPGIYVFPHRSYQEYLAGCYLARQEDFPQLTSDLCRENYGQWREVALWAAGVVSRRMSYLAVNLAAELCSREVKEGKGDITDMDWLCATLAGEVLLEADSKKAESRPAQKAVVDRVRGWLVACMERGVMNPQGRASAGRVVAKLGDPREAVTKVDKMEFCLVPEGEFRMGGMEYGDEKPVHTNKCLTYDYWISKYPVSNAQFGEFENDGGYGEKRFWKEAVEHPPAQ